MGKININLKRFLKDQLHPTDYAGESFNRPIDGLTIYSQLFSNGGGGILIGLNKII